MWNPDEDPEWQSHLDRLFIAEIISTYLRLKHPLTTERRREVAKYMHCAAGIAESTAYVFVGNCYNGFLKGHYFGTGSSREKYPDRFAAFYEALGLGQDDDIVRLTKLMDPEFDYQPKPFCHRPQQKVVVHQPLSDINLVPPGLGGLEMMSQG